MYTPVTLNSGNRYPYGFGWSVDTVAGQLRIHHGGAWQGFQTYIARYMGDDMTIVALSNLGASQPGAVTAFAVGAYSASLKMALVGGALVPTLTLSKMTSEEAEEFSAALAKREADRKAASAKGKAATDTATA